ncbi:hypothetical protein EVA_19101, partial [gut metagenome]
TEIHADRVEFYSNGYRPSESASNSMAATTASTAATASDSATSFQISQSTAMESNDVDDLPF